MVILGIESPVNSFINLMLFSSFIYLYLEIHLFLIMIFVFFLTDYAFFTDRFLSQHHISFIFFCLNLLRLLYNHNSWPYFVVFSVTIIYMFIHQGTFREQLYIFVLPYGTALLHLALPCPILPYPTHLYSVLSFQTLSCLCLALVLPFPSSEPRLAQSIKKAAKGAIPSLI